MMTVENLTINGKSFVRTSSDSFLVERERVLYTEAIDPEHLGRTYTESATPLPELSGIYVEAAAVY